jgi:uncharacterized phage protein (TIGR01671 family)
MNEIKFRAWDVANKKMCLVSDINFGDDGSARTIVFQTSPKGQYYRGLVHGENGYLMEWTGLKDKHGKEGYAGDIVKMFDRSLFVIVWNDYYAHYQLDLVKGDELAKEHDMGQLHFGEIVGNIYEHPHLLGVQQP